MSFPALSFQNNDLIFETFFVSQKVHLDSIDDILISHAPVQTRHRVSIYLNKPVAYELKSGNIMNKFLLSVFRIFHKNLYEIIAQYEHAELLTLLKILKENLDDCNIPDDLDKSILWRTVDNGFRIPRTKLIYSKSGLGLAEVLKKHDLLPEK